MGATYERASSVFAWDLVWFWGLFSFGASGACRTRARTPPTVGCSGWWYSSITTQQDVRQDVFRTSVRPLGSADVLVANPAKHPPSQSQPNHTVEYRTLTFVPPPHPATSRHLHMGVRVIAMQMRGCRAYVQATQVSQRGAQIHAQAKKAHSLARMLRAHRHLPTRVITTSRFEYARYCGQNVGGKSQAWVTMVQPSTHTT
jgi:hypothetical protein